MFTLLATASEVFTPMASAAAAVAATFFAFWMSAGKIQDRLTKEVKASIALDSKASEGSKVPQPLDVRMAHAPVETVSFDHHCTRNREAHTRFRTELDAQKEHIATVAKEIAVLEERSKNNALTLAEIKDSVAHIAEAVALMRGQQMKGKA